MKNARAQSAMEFVMTYSWALLIIIIIFVMAWQLGLFSLGGNVKPGTMGFWGVAPEDYILTGAGDFNVSLINELGTNVTVIAIEARMGSTVQSSSPSLPLVIGSGTSERVDMSGLQSGGAGDRYDILLSVDYIDSRTQTTHKSSGKLWGAYEK